MATWLLARLYANTLSNQQSRRRRNTDPDKLSSRDKQQELDDNLAAGSLFATGRASAALRQEIRDAVANLHDKRESQTIEMIAFGTISSGKSSLLNALAGRDVFRSDVLGGTTVARSPIDWPGRDRIVLTDTPGLAEVAGEQHGREAMSAAAAADLVLLVVDGPLKDYEHVLLGRLGEMHKRVLLCLNKADWYDPDQLAGLVAQLREQVCPPVAENDLLAVRSRSVERLVVRVLADGTHQQQTVVEPPDITALANRLVEIVTSERQSLLLMNLLMQSRGLVDDARSRVQLALDNEAEKLINRYMWAAAGATAANPVPFLDMAGGTAITVKMVLDLANVYQQKIDAETIIEILSQLAKSLIALIGASAAAPAVATAVGGLIVTVPGAGYLAAKLLQGMVQALVTRWIGRVFREYFKHEMQPDDGGIAEIARRQWKELTRVEELRKLIVTGRKQLDADDADTPPSN
jgi:uncharacterized protein (DUF697 family)/predicted GTPase